MPGILDFMTDTTSRLLRLLSPLQTPHTWPGDELAVRELLSDWESADGQNAG
jgi:hypothetical protein